MGNTSSAGGLILRIQVPSGRTVEIRSESDRDYTVARLAAQLETEEGIPVPEQRLTYKGTLLAPHAFLDSYGMEAGEFKLVLTRKEPVGVVTCEIRSTTNPVYPEPEGEADRRTVRYAFERSTTMLEVLNAVGETPSSMEPVHCTIPGHLWGRTTLHPETNLWDAGVRDGTVIEVVRDVWFARGD